MLWGWIQASRQLSKPTTPRVNLTGCRLTHTHKKKSIRAFKDPALDADGEWVLTVTQARWSAEETGRRTWLRLPRKTAFGMDAWANGKRTVRITVF